MHRRALIALVLVGCSPAPHPKKQPPERVAREPDDVRSGAVAVPLEGGAASHRGTLDGPASDTVDWLSVDRPAAEGQITVALRGPRDMSVKAFDGDREIRAVPHWPDKAGPPSYTIPAAPARLFLKVIDPEKDAGAYELAIAFVVAAPVPIDAGVDAPPDAALRYCAVGEVSDTCRRAPPCDWTRVDPMNPRCAPDQRPR